VTWQNSGQHEGKGFSGSVRRAPPRRSRLPQFALRLADSDRAGMLLSIVASDLSGFVQDLPMVSCDQEFESPGRPAGAFATTHWSVVVQAKDSQAPEAAVAMERLCSTYWYPLYSFVRRKGHEHEDACDLTQAFFARFLEKKYLHTVDAGLGRFRTFLLTSITHFLSNERDKRNAQRRGGGCQVVSWDASKACERYELEPVDQMTPERIFERRWAQTVMGLVVDRLMVETGRERFEVLKSFLLGSVNSMPFESAAQQLGMSLAGITSTIHRMRGRFRELVREEITHTVDSPKEVEPEIRRLLAALTD
jgi:RNA polymerase sigma-70 factor (ECF subfamily)